MWGGGGENVLTQRQTAACLVQGSSLMMMNVHDKHRDHVCVGKVIRLFLL